MYAELIGILGDHVTGGQGRFEWGRASPGSSIRRLTRDSGAGI